MIDGGLRKLFTSHVKFDWCPVETGSTSVGAPDSNFCCGGVEGWVEYKATKTNLVKFRPMQPSWIMRRRAAGGRVRIAVRDTSEGDVLWLFDGTAVTTLVESGISGSAAMALGSWAGGPREWNWAEVRARLLG